MIDLERHIEMVTKDKPYKYIISNPKMKNEKYRRIVITLKNDQYQIEKFTQEKVFHEMLQENKLQEYISNLLLDHYKQLNAWNDEYEITIHQSKKGKSSVSKIANKNKPEKMMQHNRKKNYILEEGIVIKPLIDMGIFTASGKVVNSMYDKYKQINRFIELIDDTLKTVKEKKLTIIDFGCGKSYFTFILYYYFTEIRHIEVEMIGLDLKKEVITKCNQTAKKYGYDHLHFELGDINGYQCNFPVDMVITLHACDTATDYALFNAIQWNAKMIFSVPCCQHELNTQIKSDELSILTRYGILKERTAALMTDAIRGNLLEYCGYKTQLLEFVDFDHTPKNILIRGVKKNIAENTKKIYLEEVQNIMNTFQLNPKLYELLKQAKKIK
jgi:SAM-dependent methyltransferase